MQFDPSKAPFELANRVSYEDERPVFRVLESDRSDLSDRVVLQKATAWAYEEEWRVMKAREVGLVEFVPEALTGVILGAAISERDSGYVQEILARRRKPVNLMRAKIDRDMYRVRIGESLRS